MPQDNAKMRMQYIGVLHLLGELSTMLGDTYEAEEFRDTIERALTDAQKVIPSLHWRRTLQAFDIEIRHLPQEPAANDTQLQE